MHINNNPNLNFQGVNIKNSILSNKNKLKEQKYMKLACNKISNQIGIAESTLLELTQNVDSSRFKFLERMASKFKIQNARKVTDAPEHVLNIYSMIENPIPEHFNILERAKGSFEKIEKIFSLAKDEKSLGFVQNIQYDVLRNTDDSSKIIIDLLNSKNKDKYIENLKAISSYLKLNAGSENAVQKLDELFDSGNFNKLKFDAQFAVRKLMRKKAINNSLSEKTKFLEEEYTKERGNFLKEIFKSFIPKKNTLNKTSQDAVINMYESANKNNAKLRKAVIEQFKSDLVHGKTYELSDLNILFDKIDNNNDVKKFIQKAVKKDLRVHSISELNEILDNIPLKKANLFFNNAKRIIESTNGEERKKALLTELENPFFEPLKSIKNEKKLRITAYARPESMTSKLIRYIENEINKLRYNYIA